MMSRQDIIEAAQRLHRLTPEEIEAYDLTPIPPEGEVRAYVDDYARRIDAVFADIGRWLAEDGRYTARRTGTSLIFEPLMAYYDMPDRELPVLSVFAADGTEVLRFRPNGLWVVPTNGRVAIDQPGADRRRRLPELRLLDRAQPFEQARWTVWGDWGGQRDGEPFDKGVLLRIAKEQHDAVR